MTLGAPVTVMLKEHREAAEPFLLRVAASGGAELTLQEPRLGSGSSGYLPVPRARHVTAREAAQEGLDSRSPPPPAGTSLEDRRYTRFIPAGSAATLADCDCAAMRLTTPRARVYGISMDEIRVKAWERGDHDPRTASHRGEHCAWGGSDGHHGPIVATVMGADGTDRYAVCAECIWPYALWKMSKRGRHAA